MGMQHQPSPSVHGAYGAHEEGSQKQMKGLLPMFGAMWTNNHFLKRNVQCIFQRNSGFLQFCFGTSVKGRADLGFGVSGVHSGREGGASLVDPPVVCACSWSIGSSPGGGVHVWQAMFTYTSGYHCMLLIAVL